MTMKAERLCVKCGELVESRSTKVELCNICLDKLKTEAVPEPRDMGEWLCWHDNQEKKIHHCMSRRNLAERDLADNKRAGMPQCGLCGKDPSTTPKAPLVFISVMKQRSIDKAKLKALAPAADKPESNHQSAYMERKIKELSIKSDSKKDAKECQNVPVRPVI